MMHSILIVGGDKRQLALADMLKEKGHSVSLRGFEKLGYADETADSPAAVFLPVPYRNPDGSLKAPFADKRLDLDGIVRRYPRSVYYMGGYDAAARDAFGGQIRYIDMLADEAFLVRNAWLTAEGAICAFLKHSESALCDLNCVVTGYGRIAKFLCRLLVAHGAQVTATARRDRDLALIEAERIYAAHTRNLIHILPGADVIFNTVPWHVYGEEELKCIRADATLVELASPPYGMDMKLAEEMGVNVRLEPGLPGRYFPVSAAKAMLRVFESEEI